MVDLATFRTFPRASPGRQSEAALAERDVPVEKGVLTSEALPTRFTQELRARRRAARTDMRQSEAWAEPETAPTPPYSSPEPEAAVVDKVLHHEPSVPADKPTFADPEPEVQQFELEDLSHAPAPLGEWTENWGAEAFAPNPELVEFTPEPSVPDEAPTAPLSETVFDESAHPLLSRPVPIDEFLAEAGSPTEPLPVVKHLFESAEPHATAHEAVPAEQTWPIEPPSVFGYEDTIPVEPPEPLEPESAATIVLTAEPEKADEQPIADLPAPMLRTHYSSEPLALDYRLLGLANPLVVTVTGRLGDASPVPLTIGRIGLYRPDGFRPAPWSGFAYDISPDGRTGLVLGTRILTARGEVPVEDLVPGDTALALRGPALLPIIWIGRSIAVPPPVEIDADAFGPGRPSKTLRVGADHPIFMATMPVSARDLVNGDTIRTLDTESAELFHIDVGIAEVLLAEGVPLSSGCR